MIIGVIRVTQVCCIINADVEVFCAVTVSTAGCSHSGTVVTGITARRGSEPGASIGATPGCGRAGGGYGDAPCGSCSTTGGCVAAGGGITGGGGALLLLHGALGGLHESRVAHEGASPDAVVRVVLMKCNPLN